MSGARLPLRLLNTAGRLWQGLRPPARLEDSEGTLLAAARRETGLRDFGDEGFRDGLRVLLRAYDEEARLSPYGRFLVWQELLGVLRARLGVVAAWRREPGLREQRIERPIFVLGLTRAGTTAQHFLLAQDPRHQVLEYWLAAAPGPRPPRERWEADPRYRAATRALRTSYWLDPGLRAIHDLRPDGPEECRHLLAQSFTDDTFDSNATLPSYSAWFAGCDMRASYAWHRGVLALIGSTSPERRWVLKYPAHLKHLGALLETYPDACIVQTHRDPAEVLPSLCSLVTRWRGIYEERVDRLAVARWQVEMWAARIQQALAVRDADDPQRYCDLQHRQISEDPLGAVRRVYEHFGLELGAEAEERMRSWLAENPPGRHGGHHYGAEDFGLRRAELAERFAVYRARFVVDP